MSPFARTLNQRLATKRGHSHKVRTMLTIKDRDTLSRGALESLCYNRAPEIRALAKAELSRRDDAAIDEARASVIEAEGDALAEALQMAPTEPQELRLSA